MIGKNQGEKKPIAAAEAMKILDDRKDEGELGYEQKLAYDHIKKFVSLSAEQAKKMVKELQEYGVGEVTAIHIADVMPLDVTQLKHILIREKKTFEDDEIQKMMGIVQNYRGK